MNRRPILAAVAAASFLAACGGGGGTDAAPIAALQAYTQLVTEARTIDVSGTTSTGNLIRIVSNTTPQAAAPFPYNGVSGSRLANSGQVYIDGVLQPDAGSATSFFASNFVQMGTVYEDGSCENTRDGKVPPASAEVGSSGGLYNYSFRAACSSTSPVVYNGRATWQVQEHDNIVFFCVTDKATVSGITLEAIECHESATDGTIGPRSRVELITTTSAGTDDFVATSY